MREIFEHQIDLVQQGMRHKPFVPSREAEIGFRWDDLFAWMTNRIKNHKRYQSNEWISDRWNQKLSSHADLVKFHQQLYSVKYYKILQKVCMRGDGTWEMTALYGLYSSLMHLWFVSTSCRTFGVGFSPPLSPVSSILVLQPLSFTAYPNFWITGFLCWKHWPFLLGTFTCLRRILMSETFA